MYVVGLCKHSVCIVQFTVTQTFLATGKSDYVSTACQGREIGQGLAEVLQVFQVQTRASGNTAYTNPWERCVCTNGGKFLCMFLVALALGESTVGVEITPLKAFTDQQVNAYYYTTMIL